MPSFSAPECLFEALFSQFQAFFQFSCNFHFDIFKLLSMTIIDIHTHLLPKVDDSTMRKWKFSSMMGKYKEVGIQHLVFSPHIDDPYVDTDRSRIDGTFEWACEKAAKYGIKCYLGSEFYVRDQNELSFIPHFGSHVLCETDTTFAPEHYLETVEKIISQGYKVILAHVERYRFLSPESELFHRLHDELGCLVQVNARGARTDVGRKWLKAGVVDFIATDNHGDESLPLALYEILGQYPYVARKMDSFVQDNLG